jgi:hypothetical protein
MPFHSVALCFDLCYGGFGLVISPNNDLPWFWMGIDKTLYDIGHMPVCYVEMLEAAFITFINK